MKIENLYDPNQERDEAGRWGGGGGGSKGKGDGGSKGGAGIGTPAQKAEVKSLAKEAKGKKDGTASKKFDKEKEVQDFLGVTRSQLDADEYSSAKFGNRSGTAFRVEVIHNPTFDAWKREERFNDFERDIYSLDELVSIEAPEKEPRWNKLFPIGIVKHREDFPGGKIEFSKTLLQDMIKNFASLKIKTGHELQLNYHHLGGSILDSGAPLESTVAAGWIQDLELRDDGLYALIKWTDRAKTFIEKEELKYLSPEFALNYRSRDTGKVQGPTLLGAALTNTPFLKELPRVAATDKPEVEQNKPSETQEAPKAKGATMDKAKLCSLLGLNAEASDEDVLGKITGMMEGANAGTKVMSETQANVVKLSEENKTLGTKVAKLEAQKLEGDVESYLDAKVREGRVLPAQREGYKKLALSAGLEAIKPICDAAQVVALGERGVPGTESTGNKQADAQNKLDARIKELQKNDSKMSWTQAHTMALSEMPNVNVILYNETNKAKPRATDAD